MIIILQGKEHEVFERQGENLFMKRTLNITEALCGFSFSVTHLDGRNIVIKSGPGDVISPGLFVNWFTFAIIA